MRGAELDLTHVKRIALAGRPSKANRGLFASLPGKGGSFRAFYDGMPAILAADELRALVAAMREARKRRKPILWMIGAHVLKCGLSPLLLDLMKRGYLTAIATNGAGAIHDAEIAMAGQ